MQQFDETMDFGFKEKVLPTEEEINAWVNDQRESGKKRNSEGEPFQFDNLELVEQDYKKRRANGGCSSSSWLHHGTHLYGTHTPSRGTDDWSWEAIQDCDHKQQREAIFPKHSSVYYDSHDGKLLPWHDVKACNGIVWRHEKAYLTENADKCSYVGPPKH